MADQGSRLFERRRREFERDPASTEHHRLPRRCAPGSQAAGSPSFAFFCLLFLARQEKKVPRRGHIPASAFSTSNAAHPKAQSAQEPNRKPIQRPCNKRNKLQIK